jgi:hypothetical protein
MKKGQRTANGLKLARMLIFYLEMITRLKKQSLLHFLTCASRPLFYLCFQSFLPLFFVWFVCFSVFGLFLVLLFILIACIHYQTLHAFIRFAFRILALAPAQVSIAKNGALALIFQ